MTMYVAYLRVSTDKQGKSGLGLEAQQAAITAFLKPGDRLLAPPFIEVESGKRSDRPKLHAALARCRETGATLLIAKLDRLARDVHFISGLMKEGVPFIATDLPTSDRFMLHIYASVAEQEAEAISRRTKAALAAAKMRGVKLGGDRGYRPLQPPDPMLGAAGRKRVALKKAHEAADAIAEVWASGASSLGGIAKALNERGVLSTNGGAWTATSVKRVVERLAERNAA